VKRGAGSPMERAARSLNLMKMPFRISLLKRKYQRQRGPEATLYQRGPHTRYSKRRRERMAAMDSRPSVAPRQKNFVLRGLSTTSPCGTGLSSPFGNKSMSLSVARCVCFVQRVVGWEGQWIARRIIEMGK